MFRSRTRSAAARADRKAARSARAAPAPLFDRLEARVVLSAELTGDLLTVTGGAGADAMFFSAGGADGAIVLLGVPGVPDGATFQGVQRIRVYGKQGNDIIRVSGTPRALDGSVLRFRIDGGNGNDTIDGGVGDDDLRGGNGRDTITAGKGNDKLRGGNADDFLDGQEGDDRISGKNGRDTLLGGAGDDNLRGNSGADRLRGGSGDDILRGGFGPDDLFGGLGDDLLFGDRGRDELRGVLAELADFNREDANGFDVLPTDPERGTLSDDFWGELDQIVGERDMTGDEVKATTAIQLLRARSADEGHRFDDEFGDLSSGTRSRVRFDTHDIIDEYLDDMYRNPEDINEFSMDAIRRTLRPWMPGSVRGEFDDYMESLVELDNQLEDFGRALDQIENDANKDPWFREFEAFFIF